MKKTLLIAALIVMLVVAVFALTGCGNKDEGIVGSWEYSGYGTTKYVYTFNADKTGNYDAGGSVKNFKYEDSGDKVTITYDGATMSNEFEYKIEGNKLIIKDSFGNDVEYVKK